MALSFYTVYSLSGIPVKFEKKDFSWVKDWTVGEKTEHNVSPGENQKKSFCWIPNLLNLSKRQKTSFSRKLHISFKPLLCQLLNILMPTPGGECHIVNKRLHCTWEVFPPKMTPDVVLLTFYLPPSSGQIFNLPKTLFYDQKPAKAMTIPSACSCDDEDGKH